MAIVLHVSRASQDVPSLSKRSRMSYEAFANVGLSYVQGMLKSGRPQGPPTLSLARLARAYFFPTSIAVVRSSVWPA